MREPILKAVAMPPRIFWVPVVPAIVNFSVQMGITLMFVVVYQWNPLWFIPFILIGHIIMAAIAWREPHMSNMMMTYGPMASPSKNIYPSKGNKLAP
ncbi:MAG: hypothetical protein IJY58_03165 [Alphaproteobacteria bacterium]|nr:hypothetical protein [Alphaproteobacteria bacterium]